MSLLRKQAVAGLPGLSPAEMQQYLGAQTAAPVPADKALAESAAKTEQAAQAAKGTQQAAAKGAKPAAGRMARAGNWMGRLGAGAGIAAKAMPPWAKALAAGTAGVGALTGAYQMGKSSSFYEQGYEDILNKLGYSMKEAQGPVAPPVVNTGASRITPGARTQKPVQSGRLVTPSARRPAPVGLGGGRPAGITSARVR